MTCAAARNLIDRFVDCELDGASSCELAEHLAECAACSSEHQAATDLQASIQRTVPRYSAPDPLRTRVQDALRAEAAQRWRDIPWRGFAIAASVLLAASLAWNIALVRSRPATNDQIVSNLAGSHVRSLIAAHLLDIPSTDQHTVKPWFNGKLDFSPDVPDFKDRGFPLIGGRIDYIENRRAAVLVYQRRQHVINVFVWPSSADTSAAASRDGYHFLSWNRNGMSYWAVSDLNPTELSQFRNFFLE
jgi:anti-sigma factor RsiW